jgi:hypothetical protein
LRWRRRRPTDFVLTWMRWFAELMASLVNTRARGQRRLHVRGNNRFYDNHPEIWKQEIAVGQIELDAEAREANTGHRTPRRFWRCKACRREGHVF